MANERDRMTDERNRDDSIPGGMGDEKGGSRRDQSTEQVGDESSERMRGTGDELDDDEFEETEEGEEEEEEEEDGTI